MLAKKERKKEEAKFFSLTSLREGRVQRSSEGNLEKKAKEN